MKFTTRPVSTGFPISRHQSYPTFPPPPTSQPTRPRHPALHRLHNFRTIALPMLLALVFTTLILNAIYAYCVAKPHTDIADQLAKNGTAEANGSLFGRRSTSVPLLAREAAPITTSTTNSAERSGSETALLFYTLLTPTHLRSQTSYKLLLSFTTLLTAGWVTALSFWMHCELPPLNKSGQKVCPAQVRGHFMYGIHEVSIAKTAVGWIVAVAYAAHTLVLVGGYKSQRRIWRLANGKGEIEHGEAAEIVVGIDMKDINSR
ncbi:hypothetical protein PV05_08101 [Exophiala xenobiotica]|uniref:Uncharacterized protein n=1 Tax=Exophiala xenobiotica TaxID=348802 RepID=A0A0D2CR68_9EURO|nr:uncharacterized protein PV05_08101 [Exophiala xenobiotica]KIW52467.1 hypothetical protein PV05_08101 [Exophiala xenobiotica]